MLDGSFCHGVQMCRQMVANMAEEVNIFYGKGQKRMTYSHFGLKNGLCSRLLTKLLAGPHGPQDPPVYIYDDPMLFLIPKTQKQPAIQDSNDPPPPGSASGAATAILLIIYLFIFIIISKIVYLALNRTLAYNDQKAT